MAEQPGVMIYFELAEPLKGLSYEEKGKLLEAILDYGQYGVVPEFDGLLRIVWGFIRPKIDVDASKYRKKVVKNTYSSYCAKESKANRTAMNFEEWLEYMGMDTEGNRTVPNGSNRHPTTTSTITPTITPTLTTTPSITPSITTSSSAYPSATAASYTSSPSSESWENVKHRVDTQRRRGNG